MSSRQSLRHLSLHPTPLAGTPASPFAASVARARLPVGLYLAAARWHFQLSIFVNAVSRGRGQAAPDLRQHQEAGAAFSLHAWVIAPVLLPRDCSDSSCPGHSLACRCRAMPTHNPFPFPYRSASRSHSPFSRSTWEVFLLLACFPPLQSVVERFAFHLASSLRPSLLQLPGGTLPAWARALRGLRSGRMPLQQLLSAHVGLQGGST